MSQINIIEYLSTLKICILIKYMLVVDKKTALTWRTNSNINIYIGCF